jgi:2-C-methyl-D-erythritol 2,4-cyclodiphosphate synthase
VIFRAPAPRIAPVTPDLPVPAPLPLRIGHGYDLHRLQPGGTLMLGGLSVANDLSPVAHSDGDVVLHALVDALLGAMAWGDIGELFPNNDPQWKGAPSRVFVTTVYDKVRSAGYVVQNLDVTILAERPRLKAFKKPMTETIARLLSVAPNQVNVKAGTNEGCDAIGRGEAIAAHAVILLGPDIPLESPR